MKSILFTILFSIIGGLGSFYISANYTVVDDYSIRFTTKRAEGTFQGLKGIVDFNENDLGNSKMNVSIDVATIMTGNEQKDDHAKGSKWFDVDNYPKMGFKTESITKTEIGYVATGTLTIKDVSADLSIPFVIESEGIKVFLLGSTKINRKKFNIKGNSFSFLVGSDVTIDLKVPANFN